MCGRDERCTFLTLLLKVWSGAKMLICAAGCGEKAKSRLPPQIHLESPAASSDLLLHQNGGEKNILTLRCRKHQHRHRNQPSLEFLPQWLPTEKHNLPTCILFQYLFLSTEKGV